MGPHKGGVVIPPYIQKGVQREAVGGITQRKDNFVAHFREKRKQSKDRAVCEAWLNEQRLANIE